MNSAAVSFSGLRNCRAAEFIRSPRQSDYVMKKTNFAVAACMILCLVGCDQYQLVDTQDTHKKLIDLKTCNCEVLSKDELKTLREQAELSKHVNRYQMRNEGYRTWR